MKAPRRMARRLRIENQVSTGVAIAAVPHAVITNVHTMAKLHLNVADFLVTRDHRIGHQSQAPPAVTTMSVMKPAARPSITPQ